MATTMEHSASNSSSKGDGAENLMLKLDDLFEQYLNLLDQYQTARQQLSTQLSAVRRSSSDPAFLANICRATCVLPKQILRQLQEQDMVKITTMSG
jgi:hypothetical protein